MSEIDDILGFDPQDLSVNNQEKETRSGNPLIYHTRPADSKSDDGIYRSTIRVIYCPFDFKQSIFEQQTYSLRDTNGYFEVITSLTANDKNCPIFKAWKTCHYADPSKETDPKKKVFLDTLRKQALTKQEGGKQLFDKRFARYVTIQVIEDNNQPDLVGKYMFYKLPKAILTMINNKQSPTSDKKAKIPVMDFLFGRAIEIEVKPGPDDPQQPDRKFREVSYENSEVSDDIVSVTYPDGRPILDSDEQLVLDAYIREMQDKVWREKDPMKRAENEKAIRASETARKLGAIYKNVLAEIKTFCPNLVDEFSFKPWTPEVTKRVQDWIDIVLAGNDPTLPQGPTVITSTNVDNTVANAATPASSTPVAPVTPSVSEPEDDDLPF